MCKLKASHCATSCVLSDYAGYADSEKCDNTKSQRWEIEEGKTEIRLAGTDFCIDSCKGEWLFLTTAARGG